jgi:hypothetical protein
MTHDITTLGITIECRYAECPYAECHDAQCHYAECRFAEYRVAKKVCPQKLSKALNIQFYFPYFNLSDQLVRL